MLGRLRGPKRMFGHLFSDAYSSMIQPAKNSVADDPLLELHWNLLERFAFSPKFH